MMNDLFSGIFSFFSATPHNDFYNLIGGRLAFFRGYSEWTDNYSVFRGVDIQQEDTFDAEIDSILLQFSVFSKDRSTCGDIHLACRDLFSGTVIPVLNHGGVQLIRGHTSPLLWTGDINDLWIAVIDFNTMIQRT